MVPSKKCIVNDCVTHVEISAATLDNFDLFHVSSKVADSETYQSAVLLTFDCFDFLIIY